MRYRIDQISSVRYCHRLRGFRAYSRAIPTDCVIVIILLHYTHTVFTPLLHHFLRYSCSTPQVTPHTSYVTRHKFYYSWHFKLLKMQWSCKATFSAPQKCNKFATYDFFSSMVQMKCHHHWCGVHTWDFPVWNSTFYHFVFFVCALLFFMLLKFDLLICYPLGTPHSGKICSAHSARSEGGFTLRYISYLVITEYCSLILHLLLYV